LAVRVFLDANVLVSAAKSDGGVRALLRLLLDRRHECRVDAYVLAEARRNLVRKGPQAMQLLDEMLGRLQIAPALAGVAEGVGLEWLPTNDRPLPAAAIRLQCDVLVNGDRKHFGSRSGLKVGGVTIHSPRALAEVVLT